MRVVKTIRCKVWNATKLKQFILEDEYDNLQLYLQAGIDDGLYSANKQQADRFFKKIKKGKQYPISLRNDLIRIEKKDTKLTPYWIRIPVSGRRGGLWLPIKPHCVFPDNYEISESKVIKKKDGFYIHITIKKEIPQKTSFSSILAIDLGERVIATVCNSLDMRPKFYGRQVRGVRRHYAWLRKRLGEKKLLRKIKDIGQKEQRIVNAYLHEISRKIVDEATRTDSVIVLGDLKGIRDSTKGKGRRFSRIVANMPYYKLTEMIKYKAAWKGIPVIKVSERNTSKTCSVCGSEGKRPYQGLFVCSSCGYQANADFNGSKNILKRAMDYMSTAGASVDMPVTEPFLVSSEALSEREVWFTRCVENSEEFLITPVQALDNLKICKEISGLHGI